MSRVGIATQITLAQALAEIRERTNTLSQETSELYDLPLANLLHDALVSLRGELAKDQITRRILKGFYHTESTVTEATNLVDISTLDIWWDVVNLDELTFSDASNGSATVMSQGKFNDLKTIYTAAMMADMFVVYGANIGEKLQLRTFRGANLATAGTLTFGYPANITKRVVGTDKLDATEQMAREAIEIVIGQVQKVST